MTEGGDLSLYEMARTLVRMEGEINRRLADITQSLSQMVTRDLHEAHRSAMQRDIDELAAELKAERDLRVAERQAEQERRAADRRVVVGAVITAALSLIVAIVAAALFIALKWNGGP